MLLCCLDQPSPPMPPAFQRPRPAAEAPRPCPPPWHLGTLQTTPLFLFSLSAAAAQGTQDHDQVQQGHLRPSQQCWQSVRLASTLRVLQLSNHYQALQAGLGRPFSSQQRPSCRGVIVESCRSHQVNIGSKPDEPWIRLSHNMDDPMNAMFA